MVEGPNEDGVTEQYIPTQKGLYEAAYEKTNNASGKQKAPHLCKNLFKRAWDISGLCQERKTSSTEPSNALPTPPPPTQLG
jgi:hypothetical protein